MKGTLLLKNISCVVSCDEKDAVYRDVNLLIDGREIVYIGKEEVSAQKEINCQNMIIYPGLINTHHHLYQTFSRNLQKVQKMELFDWLTNLYEIWKNLDEQSIYYSSLTGMGELLKNGCTTCFDHHYVFPEIGSENFIQTQVWAAEELGIRMFASRGSMSLGKKDGGLPPDSVVQDVKTILKDSVKMIESFHDAQRFSMRNVALAPCSPFSVTPDLMKETAKLGRSYGVRLHTHLAETQDEVRFVKERFGMRPLALMESLDWVGSDVWYAHGIYFNDEEIKTLARTQTGVAHCPISNMKLSSGIARIPELIKAGVPVGLAVDGSASNDGSNLLEEIRVAYLLHRLKDSGNAPTGYEILKLATSGSAKILGRDDIGSLAVGKAADLFAINRGRLELVGADLDEPNMLGTVGFKSAVDLTVVNGKVVVKDGRLEGIDEERITSEAKAKVKQYLEA